MEERFFFCAMSIRYRIGDPDIFRYWFCSFNHDINRVPNTMALNKNMWRLQAA